ncbi:DDE-type integrase/transposase/recombinase [Paenibacillus sp. NPDC057934]|uniref:DDE-type integrase/transposase/recombinase n=1 Tax=Paenibacillus sp. NPDC057934 TaxID=3346282 RepID=UPI0036DBCAA3
MVIQYRLGNEKIHLSAIKDLYSNDIVAYYLSRSNYSLLVLDFFCKSFNKHKDVTGLIVHSDQGSQYTSHACTTCCQWLAPESACHVKAIVMTMPL